MRNRIDLWSNLAIKGVEVTLFWTLSFYRKKMAKILQGYWLIWRKDQAQRLFVMKFLRILSILWNFFKYYLQIDFLQSNSASFFLTDDIFQRTSSRANIQWGCELYSFFLQKQKIVFSYFWAKISVSIKHLKNPDVGFLNLPNCQKTLVIFKCRKQ